MVTFFKHIHLTHFNWTQISPIISFVSSTIKINGLKPVQCGGHKDEQSKDQAGWNSYRPKHQRDQTEKEDRSNRTDPSTSTFQRWDDAGNSRKNRAGDTTYLRNTASRNSWCTRNIIRRITQIEGSHIDQKSKRSSAKTDDLFNGVTAYLYIACSRVQNKTHPQTWVRNLCPASGWWLGWMDSNHRNDGVKVRCLTAWLQPITD